MQGVSEKRQPPVELSRLPGERVPRRQSAHGRTPGQPGARLTQTLPEAGRPEEFSLL